MKKREKRFLKNKCIFTRCLYSSKKFYLFSTLKIIKNTITIYNIYISSYYYYI